MSPTIAILVMVNNWLNEESAKAQFVSLLRHFVALFSDAVEADRNAQLTPNGLFICSSRNITFLVSLLRFSISIHSKRLSLRTPGTNRDRITKSLVVQRLSSSEMNTTAWVQVLDWAVCISYSVNNPLGRHASNYFLSSYR